MKIDGCVEEVGVGGKGATFFVLIYQFCQMDFDGKAKFRRKADEVTATRGAN